MLLSEIINEIREANLFHGTSAANAIHILQQNTFDAKTEHLPAKGGLTTPVMGVSFTRTFQSARRSGDVIFVVDQTKLRYRHRIVPMDFWGNSVEPNLVGIGRRRGKYAESEEFVVGPVKGADQYILSIHVAKRAAQRLADFSPEIGAVLLQHPLVVLG